MFYVYRQNNSGGGWDNNPSRGISIIVIVEATSPEDADVLAESIGLYFDGCEKGRDCSCCGDRWYTAAAYDGSMEPLYYGKKIDEAAWTEHYVSGQMTRPYGADEGEPYLTVHYKDGQVDTYEAGPTGFIKMHETIVIEDTKEIEA